MLDFRLLDSTHTETAQGRKRLRDDGPYPERRMDVLARLLSSLQSQTAAEWACSEKAFQEQALSDIVAGACACACAWDRPSRPSRALV